MDQSRIAVMEEQVIALEVAVEEDVVKPSGLLGTRAALG